MTDSMRIDIHHYIHRDNAEEHSEIVTLLNLVLARETAMAGELEALTAQVATNNTEIGSAITLLQGLKAALDAAIAAQQAGDNGAALAALSASLGTKDAELAAAIIANTPAAPTP